MTFRGDLDARTAQWSQSLLWLAIAGLTGPFSGGRRIVAVSVVRLARLQPQSALLAIFGFAIIALISVHLFLIKQSLLPDTGGFLNPPYEFVQQGRVVYPAYGPEEANRMIIHPPVQAWVTGMLMAAGLPYFGALALNVFIGTIIAIAAILASGLAPPTKIALAISLYVVNFQFVDLALAREELAINMWWIAGLFIFENARIRRWPATLLVLGSFVTAYACSLHYHAWPGLFAVGVYATVIAVSLPLRQALLKMRWIAIGLAAVLLPLSIYFLLPHWEGIVQIIRAVSATPAASREGIANAFAAHVARYRQYSEHALIAGRVSPLCYLFYPILYLGIPAALIALPIFAIRRETRIFAFAAAPLTLSMLFAVSRKFPDLYFRPEFTLFLAALFIAFFAASRSLFPVITGASIRGRLPIVAASMIAICVLPDGDLWGLLRGRGFVDEIRLERAAAKEIIGPHAKVGGASVLAWFTGGGERYRNLVSDLIYPEDLSHVDIRSILGGVDAVVTQPVDSGITYNKQRKSLASFYVDGLLSLRGIYAGRTIRGIQEGSLVASSRPPAKVTAFFWRADQLFRFTSSATGKAVLIAVETRPQRAETRDRAIVLSLPLPARVSGEATPFLDFMVEDLEDSAAVEERCEGCVVRDRLTGDLIQVDPDDLVDSISYRDEHVQLQ